MTGRIISRSEWGAIHERGAGPAPLPATETFLHHSVTIAPDLLPPFSDDYAAVRTLERIGESRFGRGISYTFVITPLGLIFEGHGIDRRGAHTLGHNVQGRAICFVGNYDVDPPTPQMIDAAGWLLAHGFLSGWWTASQLTGGHRDVRGTACPGRHAYAAMPQIDAAAAAYVQALFAIPDEETLMSLTYSIDDLVDDTYTEARKTRHDDDDGTDVAGRNYWKTTIATADDKREAIDAMRAGLGLKRWYA